MSPKTKQQYEQIREASAQKILMAALELFGTKGYDATSVSELASKANVSKGLIYNYFQSKRQIMEKLFVQFNEQELLMLEKVKAEDPRKMLEKLLRYFFQEIRQNPELWKLISSLALQVGKFDFIHDPLVDKVNSYYQLFERLLSQIGFENPGQEAKLLAALLDGIGFQALTLEKDYPLEEVENYLISKYCRNAI